MIKAILQTIVEIITGRTCRKCAWFNGAMCTVKSDKYDECVSKIYPKHFKKKAPTHVLKGEKMTATTREKLKTCPFCGGEVELLDYTDRIYGFWDYKIACTECRAYMNSPSTAVVEFTDTGLHQTRNEETMRKAKSELIISWNTRQETDT